jgi:hypothetical protein
MNKQHLTILSILIITILSACAGAPEQTLGPNDIANTAFAAAWTEVYMTQAALPTSTPIPPTSTPEPTITPLPSLTPTLSNVVLGNTPALASETPDPCDLPPPDKPKGTVVQVSFVNKSGGSANLSFGMYKPNSLGECGTYNYTLGAYETAVVKVLAGCYWGYAWITGKEPSIAKSTDPICLTDPAVIRGVTVGKEWIGID